MRGERKLRIEKYFPRLSFYAFVATQIEDYIFHGFIERRPKGLWKGDFEA
jgi:hypothetical protein